MKTFYNGRSDKAVFNEKELETLAELIEQGFIKKEDDRFISGFIGFDSNSFSKIINLENRDRTFVYEELKQMLDDIVNILDGEVPKHLRGQLEAHAFMALLYIVSHVMRYLNERTVLYIPSGNERNTLAFCMFRDCSGLLPVV